MGYGILDIGGQTRQQGLAGLRDAANRDFERVLKLVPPNTPAARRAEAGHLIWRNYADLR